MALIRKKTALDVNSCNSVAELERAHPFEHNLKASLGLSGCPTIHSAAEVAMAFHEMSHLPRLVVVAGTLDYENRMICWTIVSEEREDLVTLDEDNVFASAIRNSGSAIFLVQNSPSGSLVLSYPARQLLRKIVQRSHELKCPLLDHVIVTPDAYRSALGSVVGKYLHIKENRNVGKIITG
jgi:DNA repair protein RadC